MSHWVCLPGVSAGYVLYWVRTLGTGMQGVRHPVEKADGRDTWIHGLNYTPLFGESLLKLIERPAV